MAGPPLANLPGHQTRGIGTCAAFEKGCFCCNRFGPFGPYKALWCLVPTRGGRDLSQPAAFRLRSACPDAAGRELCYDSQFPFVHQRGTASTSLPAPELSAAAFRGHWCICCTQIMDSRAPRTRTGRQPPAAPHDGRFPALVSAFRPLFLFLVWAVARAVPTVSSTGPAVRPIQAESVLALVFIHGLISPPH